MRGHGLFEPALPLGVDKPPAVLDEFAPSVPLGERDGELGLKLVVNRLVVPDNGVVSHLACEWRWRENGQRRASGWSPPGCSGALLVAAVAVKHQSDARVHVHG